MFDATQAGCIVQLVQKLVQAGADGQVPGITEPEKQWLRLVTPGTIEQIEELTQGRFVPAVRNGTLTLMPKQSPIPPSANARRPVYQTVTLDVTIR